MIKCQVDALAAVEAVIGQFLFGQNQRHRPWLEALQGVETQAVTRQGLGQMRLIVRAEMLRQLGGRIETVLEEQLLGDCRVVETGQFEPDVIGRVQRLVDPAVLPVGAGLQQVKAAQQIQRPLRSMDDPHQWMAGRRRGRGRLRQTRQGRQERRAESGHAECDTGGLVHKSLDHLIPLQREYVLDRQAEQGGDAKSQRKRRIVFLGLDGVDRLA